MSEELPCKPSDNSGQIMGDKDCTYAVGHPCPKLMFVLEERDRTFALMLERAEKAEAERDAYRQELDGVLKMIGEP